MTTAPGWCWPSRRSRDSCPPSPGDGRNSTECSQPIAENHPLTRDLDPVQLNEVLALHAGFLLRTAAGAGPGADPHLIAMMTALGLASLRWLRRRMGDVGG
ncbi:hypothetical protein [Streptomyces malaysiensis]|uniref:hypothetical protein n=1 Tax=Streptomyces malaysiensis TaxID=92644 RepID=UPI0020C62005|nr:hypothetical protein [Streptomyces samsunensis]